MLIDAHLFTAFQAKSTLVTVSLAKLASIPRDQVGSVDIDREI